MKAPVSTLSKSRSPAVRQALAASGFVTRFIDERGIVDIDRVAGTFRMTKGQLAETIGLGTAAVGKAERRVAPRAQARIREMLEIVALVREWAGGETQAMAWYRSQPIAALDGRTPEALVKAGEAGAVRDYLDHLALGGFA
ncbi:MAG: antitoxin Xre/MbcA/ParS toxin-binding domain-containing protein [Alphaproteobacteria bacterium]